MNKPNRPIKILLYEDKADYGASFKTAAQKERILVDIVDNVDDLLEKVNDNNRKYQFIVLDARAYLHEGQSEGSEDEMNLVVIIQALDQLKFKDKVIIPYCINTGFSDLKLRLSEKLTCPIFEKGNESELFKHIWNKYLETDDAKLLLNHPEIFEFALTHFDDADYIILANLFHGNKYVSSSLADRVGTLTSLRRIAEHLMDIINRDYLSGSATISSPATRLGDITQFLANDMPVHVLSTLTAIRKISSRFGNHTPNTSELIKGYPSEGLISGLALSLKDVCIWGNGKIG